jgi:hypothetical protein
VWDGGVIFVPVDINDPVDQRPIARDLQADSLRSAWRRAGAEQARLALNA